jgi:hypothetical protein
MAFYGLYGLSHVPLLFKRAHNFPIYEDTKTITETERLRRLRAVTWYKMADRQDNGDTGEAPRTAGIGKHRGRPASIQRREL